MQNPSSRHHYTQDELLELSHQLSKTSGKFINLQAPKVLSAKQKKEFYDLAYKLLSYGMSELDEDCLANYIIAKELFIHYRQQQVDIAKAKPYSKWHIIQKVEDKDLKKLLEDIIENEKSLDAKYYQQLADKEFKKCMDCASALGLTITSRAKLVMREVNSENVDL